MKAGANLALIHALSIHPFGVITKIVVACAQMQEWHFGHCIDFQ